MISVTFARKIPLQKVHSQIVFGKHFGPQKVSANLAILIHTEGREFRESVISKHLDQWIADRFYDSNALQYFELLL